MSTLKTEVGRINKQKYLAELTRLLGFMSAWDREAALEKYRSLLDEAEDEDACMASLGSPTRLAISLARDYVPSPRPEVQDAPVREVPVEVISAAELAEDAEDRADTAGDAAAEVRPPEAAAAVFDSDTVPAPAAVQAEQTDGEDEGLPEEKVDSRQTKKEAKRAAKAEKKRARGRVRKLVLILYLLPALVIGLPVAIVLIALGVPILLAGAGIVGGAIYAVIHAVAALNMVADILLLLGGAVLLCGVGLLIVWLGLWLSISLGSAWIGGILKLGRRLCVRKEVPAE